MMTMPSRHILFADDDVLTQWIMTDALTEAGFAVTNACRGMEATALLDGAADFDLLLADVDLPDNMNGHALGDLWLATLPGRPLIYTGKSCGPVVRMLGHHEHFLEKPFDIATLLHLVEWALEDASFRPFVPAYARRGQHVH